MADENFDSWAIVELFGHQKIAGRVREETIGGCSFVRVDVPATETELGFTKFYGNGAIYSMTPTSEAVVRAALKQIQPEPVSVWIPEIRQLPAGPPPETTPDICPECSTELAGYDSCGGCGWVKD